MKRVEHARPLARLRTLEPALRRALRGPCRLPRGATLLVAVSGGADSTALLVSLASLAREFALSLEAAHLHHGLRGRDADRDLRFVRGLCERFGIPLTAARRDCRGEMRRRGLSGEAGLRVLRREWLAAVARRVGAAAIATAHTADDQLETLLMRLARGAGLAGAAGMRARQGAWLKPFLGVTRADIEHDLRTHGLAWCEDASNAEPAYLRNRIRHVAIPALLDALGIATAEPAARRAGLARRAAAHAADVAGAARVLARAAERSLARARAAGTRDGAAEPGYAVEGLSRLPSALRRLAIQRAWRESGDPASPGLTARQLAPLVTALAERRRPAETGTEVALPDGWRASIQGGSLRFGRVPSAAGEPARATGDRPGRRLRRGASADARLHGNHGRPGTGRAASRSPRRPDRRKAARGRPAARSLVPEER